MTLFLGNRTGSLLIIAFFGIYQIGIFYKKCEMNYEMKKAKKEYEKVKEELERKNEESLNNHNIEDIFSVND